jgi:hypothetical protein
MHPLENLTKRAWLMSSFFSGYLEHTGAQDIAGVAYGWDEADYALQTMHKVRNELFEVKAYAHDVTLPRFVRDVKRAAEDRHLTHAGFEGAMKVSDFYPKGWAKQMRQQSKDKVPFTKWRYTAVTVAKPQPVPKYLASGTEIVRKPPRSSSYTRGPAAELPHPADKAQTTSVFYHIYADPSSLSSVDQQARVVAQQLKVVKASPLASSPLVFVTIGSPAMASRAISVAHAFYPHGGFKHLGHHAVGWEDKTLQALYEHCAANPSKSVVYLHNKGSHHPSKTNSRLRAALTRAVLSAECAIYPPHRRVGIQACDICGFRFRGDPMPNLQGNMWSADCKHIASLIAPAAFGGALAAMHNVVDHNMTLKQWFKPARSDVSWQADRASWTGLDRTAYEYWVASHPNTKPCDVWGDTELEAGGRGRRGGGYMLPTNRSWLLERRTFAGRETVSELRHPWFALQGRLYQWQVLYGQAPEAKSWAWKFWAYSHYKKGRWVSV